MSMASTFGAISGTVTRDLASATAATRGMLADDRSARRFLATLLALNLALIALPVFLEGLEILGLIPDTPRPLAHPGTDGSLPEMLNYAQSGLAALFLGLTWARTRSVVFLAWAAMFTFILLDDSLQYHEVFGAWLTDVLALPAFGDLRAVDTGEVLAWILAGAVLIPLAVAAVLRSGGLERGFGLLMLLIFGALVFFAVIVDMIHVLLPYRAVLLFEDGGEMLAVAAACVLALVWYRNYRQG
jgi:hypothetical protein